MLRFRGSDRPRVCDLLHSFSSVNISEPLVETLMESWYDEVRLPLSFMSLSLTTEAISIIQGNLLYREVLFQVVNNWVNRMSPDLQAIQHTLMERGITLDMFMVVMLFDLEKLLVRGSTVVKAIVTRSLRDDEIKSSERLIMRILCYKIFSYNFVMEPERVTGWSDSALKVMNGEGLRDDNRGGQS
jgi:hypothetical protein